MKEEFSAAGAWTPIPPGAIEEGAAVVGK